MTTAQLHRLTVNGMLRSYFLLPAPAAAGVRGTALHYNTIAQELKNAALALVREEWTRHNKVMTRVVATRTACLAAIHAHGGGNRVTCALRCAHTEDANRTDAYYVAATHLVPHILTSKGTEEDAEDDGTRSFEKLCKRLMTALPPNKFWEETDAFADVLATAPARSDREAPAEDSQTRQWWFPLLPVSEREAAARHLQDTMTAVPADDMITLSELVREATASRNDVVVLSHLARGAFRRRDTQSRPVGRAAPAPLAAPAVATARLPAFVPPAYMRIITA